VAAELPRGAGQQPSAVELAGKPMSEPPVRSGAGRRLVLASASPRRRELLAELGLPFEVVPSRVDEAGLPERPAPALATALALAKARDVAARVEAGALVLGADTLVVLDGRPFGKPASADDARRMLAALGGRAHEVVTGVAVVEAGGGREATAAVVSRVLMRPYGAAEIDAYLVTGEPFDKAGAYAVQGEGGRLVERVEGCYRNVVGLPVTTAARLLRGFGLPPVTAPAGPGPGPSGPR
jgi:septum formation protein